MEKSGGYFRENRINTEHAHHKHRHFRRRLRRFFSRVVAFVLSTSFIVLLIFFLDRARQKASSKIESEFFKIYDAEKERIEQEFKQELKEYKEKERLDNEQIY